MFNLQLMRLISDLGQAGSSVESVVAIGAFDGVHCGHQALIGQLVARARATTREAVLITFHPHPREVLNGIIVPRYLTTPGEKTAILEQLGIDLLAILSFTPEMAETPASVFVAQVAMQLRMRELWVGPDFALGRHREGDVASLHTLGQLLGFQLQVVEPVMEGGRPISSSRIRELVLAGRMEEAARLLGRFYSLTGEVVHGNHRGQRLGFPTANLQVRAERIVPPHGVYATYAWLGEECYPAVTNIGLRPTFAGRERWVEVHLLGFEGDLYGTDLMVEFVTRLREEMHFSDAEALILQMQRDVERASQVLARG